MEKGEMAAVKKSILSLLLALALTVSAFAMEIPTDTVVQNLNGSQQLIKTYTLPPDADPQKLIQEPFELNGFLYTFADIVKTENRVEDRKYHIEQVTVETETSSLPEIQKQFAPTLAYDDGLYSGTLTFDSSAIFTYHRRLAGLLRRHLLRGCLRLPVQLRRAERGRLPGSGSGVRRPEHHPDRRHGAHHPTGPSVQRGDYGGCGRLRRQRGRRDGDLRRPVHRAGIRLPCIIE